MKLKALILVITVSAMVNNLIAVENNKNTSEQKGGELFKEFDSIEKEIYEKKYSQTAKDEQKKITLAKAMKAGLLRFFRYKDYDKVDKTNIAVEVFDKKANIYYVKYDKFVGRFRFSVSPENYLAIPVESKIIVKPGEEIPKLKNDPWQDGEQASSSSSNNNNKK